MSLRLFFVFIVLHQIHFHTTHAADDIGFKSQEYMTCPTSSTFNGNELFSVAGRSSMDCVRRCSLASGCVAVNICPNSVRGSEQTTKCGLLRNHNPQGCNSLTIAASSPCFFAQKVCRNGGTPVADTCQCPVQYAGRYCQRLVRDCKEIYEAGLTSSAHNGIYRIQPVNAPQAFPVRCDFAYGGAMYVLRRKTQSWHSADWAAVKRGLGQDLNSFPSSYDYFIGMENLHHLSVQASYRVLVWFFGTPSNVAAFYYNCSVGSEESGYALVYDSFGAGQSAPYTDNGFPATIPVRFFTQDRDSNNCAAKQGAPGWYGSDCTGYSLFAAVPTWPVAGSSTTASKLFLSLERTSDGFYVDL